LKFKILFFISLNKKVHCKKSFQKLIIYPRIEQYYYLKYHWLILVVFIERKNLSKIFHGGEILDPEERVEPQDAQKAGAGE
jgi:hypothetical protein